MKAILITCLSLVGSLLPPGATAQTRYTVSADQQEVTDARTGLVWRRCAEGMTWSGSACAGSATSFLHEAALQHASAEATRSGLSWRLPNIKELSSIADRSTASPAIDPAAFPGTPSAQFWSSTPPGFSAAAAFGVHFLQGDVNPYLRNVAYHVRLVRAGQ